MEKKILHSAYLENCPYCNSKLELSNTLGDRPTTCQNCMYTEPAGNAPVITFLSASFAEYGALNGVDTAYLRDTEWTIKECMVGNGLFPLFVKRALQIQQVSGFDKVPGLNLELKCVRDVKGLIDERVVMSNSTINIANTMTILSEVMHETMSLTTTLDKRLYANQIRLDLMPSWGPRLDIQDPTSSQMLHSALEIALKKQSLGTSPRG